MCHTSFMHQSVNRLSQRFEFRLPALKDCTYSTRTEKWVLFWEVIRTRNIFDQVRTFHTSWGAHKQNSWEVLCFSTLVMPTFSFWPTTQSLSDTTQEFFLDDVSRTNCKTYQTRAVRRENMFVCSSRVCNNPNRSTIFSVCLKDLTELSHWQGSVPVPDPEPSFELPGVFTLEKKDLEPENLALALN